MSENKKFTSEEVKEIKDVRHTSTERGSKFGQIEMELILTNQKLEELHEAKEAQLKEYNLLQEQETLIVKKLNEKYGAGTVDLESGEFIPANWWFGKMLQYL